jgi:CBS domain-containing protein
MLRVQDIMTTDVVTVSPTTTLRDAAELFARRHIGGAPVLDGQHVVGVVSTSDILTFAATSHEPAETAVRGAAGEWAEPDDSGAWDDGESAASFFADRWTFSDADAVDFIAEAAGPAGVSLDGHTVAEVMTAVILSLPPEADVTLAAERMRAADVHRLLVMERGDLVGILSTTDLARAIAGRRVGTRKHVVEKRR